MSRMQDEINRNAAPAYAGTDVSKAHLDAFFHPSNETLRVANDAAGIQKLMAQCRQRQVRLIAMEATGRYHRTAHAMLHEAGFDVAVVNPYRSRRFADALGQLAKSDRIDTKALARFAALLQPKPTLPPAHHLKPLRELNVARRQVIDE